MTAPLTRPGRLVAGRYRLLSQIGGGGMGTVWVARDELLGRQVAIKQVVPPASADPKEAEQQRQRALREGRIAARLSHPHAISVYDVAVESGQPWLVMEYLPSRSLAAVLTEDGLLRVETVAQIGAQVADALAATHAAGIVHRDVKPANILIGEGEPRVEGLVKITDFGISHASGDVTLTQTGQITGTPAFLAPEVAQGEEPGPASDVFSLGATLYTCREGQPPFGMSGNSLQQLHRVAAGRINPPVNCAGLTEPLMKMLAPTPGTRPSMAEIRDELASLVSRDGDTTTVLLARTQLRSSGRQRTATFPAAAPAEPTPSPPPPPVVPRPAAEDPPPATTPRPAAAPPVPAPPARPTDGEAAGSRRRPWLWVALGALLTVAVVLGVVWLTGRGTDDGGGGTAQQTSSPSAETSSSPPAEETTEQPAGTTGAGSETTTSAQPTATGDPLSAANVERFLVDYHELVTSDPAAAFARTGPTLREAIGSQEDYAAYWGQFSDVQVSEVRAGDGQSSALARLTWVYRDGGTESAVRRFDFVVQDGELLLDCECDP
ncbi:serine/threonine-protein kinase [Blastococcus sp. SYSU D00669]